MSNSNEDQTKKYTFSADINQLLSLIINTFYSNKDIFLRELVSNSSDALDKIRYQSLTDDSVLGDYKDLEVHIIPDLENNQLVIRDYGIGMTRQDLINNLGTIAKSGTKSFMEALKAGTDVNMIGQFGVGFYSAFLVADTVEVHSKHNTDNQWCWSSNAGGVFNISPSNQEDLGRGTKLILHMKEDMKHYLQEDQIRKIIRKHSDFIDFLIKLRTTKEEEREVTDDECDLPTESTTDTTTDSTTDSTTESTTDTTTDSTTDSTTESTTESTTDTTTDTTTDNVTVEDVEPESKKKTKKVKEVIKDWEPLNFQKPLWTRKPEDISHEEYASFYKAIANDYEEHAAVKHFSVEGQIEFKALLFIPKRAPFDLYDKGMKKMDNIKLYVRRVFIMDKIDELFPQYLCFMKGVVDSEDLPLNVSREVLQQNKITKVMRKHLIKRAIELIEELAEDTEKYKSFYESFSKNIKLGIHEDTQNKDRLAKLLRFRSIKQDSMIGFQEYIDNMPQGQKSIYYISGESYDSLKGAPFMEMLLSKGYDVLVMTEPMDEYCMNQLKHFNEKGIECVTKEGLMLETTDEELTSFTERVKQLEPLCKKIKDLLGASVEKVTVSPRLVTTPCVLVTSTYGWTANMERLVKAQALTDHSTQVQSQFMAAKKTLEINPNHPVVNKLETMCEDSEQSGHFSNITHLMFDTAQISSGFTLNEPAKYANHINRLIALGLDIELDKWEEDARGTDQQDNPLENNKSEPSVTEGNTDEGDEDGEMEQVD